jgi:sugar phosphate isomerase/epimerase
MATNVSRRDLLATSACVAAGLTGRLASSASAEAVAAASAEPFRYCLNAATIMGQKLNPLQEAEIAAKAGYSGIEPWVRNLRQYLDAGNSAQDLGRQIANLGLTVEGAIGFASWAVDDDGQRAKGTDELKRDMELVAAIGGKRIAAAPAGINRTAGVDLHKVAARYREVLELGRQAGVLPHLEIWGSSLSLSRMSEAAFVAIQADHPDACLLLDVYHLFRGGSGFEGLKVLAGSAMHVFHVNDYPAEPKREELTDAHRVYPGDGVAPYDQILGDLHRNGFRGALSLELFNRQYWEQDALQVAQTGLDKLRAVVRKALARRQP